MSTTEMNPIADSTGEMGTLEERLPPGEYNFEHFRTRHLLFDVKGTIKERGIPPGEIAPEFELPQVSGEPLRLSRLRGQPTLLHFGSFT
jgi:cytochrome oxidase Cu insertion factor (SCO1/SenC/PrrC family)